MGYVADGKSKGQSFCYRIRALWQSNMSSNLLWVCYLQAAVMAALATAFNFKLKWAVTGAVLAFRVVNVLHACILLLPFEAHSLVLLSRLHICHNVDLNSSMP